MNGMGIMLKSFGLDPEELKKQVAQYGNLMLEYEARTKRIEEKLDKILEILGNGELRQNKPRDNAE